MESELHRSFDRSALLALGIDHPEVQAMVLDQEERLRELVDGCNDHQRSRLICQIVVALQIRITSLVAVIDQARARDRMLAMLDAGRDQVGSIRHQMAESILRDVDTAALKNSEGAVHAGTPPQ